MQGIQVLNNLFLGADWKIRKNARLSHKSWDSWAIMLSQLWLHWGLAREKKWHIFSSASFCSCIHIGVWSHFCAKTIVDVPILFSSNSKQTQNLFLTKCQEHFPSQYLTKVLFTDRCRWQNFCPSLLRLVNNCVEFIYKTQKTRTKVLPSATVIE